MPVVRHADEEAAVEARVARAERAVAGVAVQIMGASVPRATAED